MADQFKGVQLKKVVQPDVANNASNTAIDDILARRKFLENDADGDDDDDDDDDWDIDSPPPPKKAPPEKIQLTEEEKARAATREAAERETEEFKKAEETRKDVDAVSRMTPPPAVLKNNLINNLKELIGEDERDAQTKAILMGVLKNDLILEVFMSRISLTQGKNSVPSRIMKNFGVSMANMMDLNKTGNDLRGPVDGTGVKEMIRGVFRTTVTKSTPDELRKFLYMVAYRVANLYWDGKKSSDGGIKPPSAETIDVFMRALLRDLMGNKKEYDAIMRRDDGNAAHNKYSSAFMWL